MAYYDFKCESCENQFEIKISPFELENVQCPSCAGKQLKRMFKPAGMFVKSGKHGGSTGPRKAPGSELPCADCTNRGGGCGF